MAKLKLRWCNWWWLFTALTIATVTATASVGTDGIPSAHLPLEARSIDDSTSQEDELISTSYVLPNQIFNDGKPYYASKDPVSGQPDFNAKKPASIEPEVNEVIDPKEKIVLSSLSPNIHDFLNLPTKYSSSKFVYPLVSSSYANLKYQGSNKNYVTNKKPTQVLAPGTPPPNYHQNIYTVPTTKLMAVPPTAPGLFDGTSSPSFTTTMTTTVTTPKRPSTTTTTSIPTTINVKPTFPSTFSPPRPSVDNNNISDYSPKYPETTPRTIPTAAPTTPRSSIASTTRKKFVPTKKYSPTTTVTTTTPITAASPTPTRMRFPDQGPFNTTSPPRPTTTTVFTTRHPTPPSNIFPTADTDSLLAGNQPLPPTTNPPVQFTPGQSTLANFHPNPGSTVVPNLDAADVYQSLEQKKTQQQIEKKPYMTLGDIFDSLAEEESAVASVNNQGGQGFDAQGNLMRPLAPSQPSPFAMQGLTQQQLPHATRPPHPTQSPVSNAHQQQQFPHDQKVISGSQENYGNDYVSYQVQQPNVMQYRPMPGQINNVVISPGQNSASFVLGSQQQVGINGHGPMEKESLFGKDRPVQYGTVISEDISALNRPGHRQESASQRPHPPASGENEYKPEQNGPAPSGSYAEEPPEPPSPYQQLPLIDSGVRPKTRPQQTQPQTQPQMQQMPKPPQQQQQQQHDQQQQQQYQHQTQQQQQHNKIYDFPQHPQNGQKTSYAPQQEKQHQQHQKTQPQYGSNPPESQPTKELLVSTNIRFPPVEDQPEESVSRPAANGPPSGPHINGHAQPLSLQQIQNSNPVVFPKNKEDDKKNQGPVTGDEVQIQQHEVVHMNQRTQESNYSPGLEQHMPSTHMEPPPRFPPAVPNQPPVLGGPHQHLGRPHGPPTQGIFAHKEFTHNPGGGSARPNPDRNLPNILPQFRPNAKISSGHSVSNYNQEPGNIRIAAQPPRRPSPAAPQFAHRRQPLMQQRRYGINRPAEYPPPSAHLNPAEANRRVYRLPPYGGQGIQYLDRMYPRRPVRPVGDEYVVERYASAAASHADGYKTLPQDVNPVPERMPAFEEEDLVINDPPQPVTPSKERNIVDETKLEPVVTLQMLQSHKKAVTLPTDDTGSGEIQVPSDETEEAASPNGLYVVYPMKGGKDSLPAIAHIESSSSSEYQNTPFSVVRNEQEEPVLKNKKPQSLQQQVKSQSLKDSFPYPIEKPDPSYSELNAGLPIAPRIINGAYAPGTEAPIAFAFTPTEPNAIRRSAISKGERYSNVNLATPVIDEIRTDTQTEEGLSNNDFDLRGQNLEKDFMAPFYPSVSLGSATNSPSNGWNILPSSSDNTIYAKSNINRADVAEGGDGNGAETTVKPFELVNFQPELQGGFKPIYPPGYKVEDSVGTDHSEMSNGDGGGFSSTSPSPKISVTSTTPATISDSIISSTQPADIGNSPLASEQVASALTATTETVPTTTQRKKSVFETSLEALLFGNDEDFEEDVPKEHQQQQPTPLAAKSGPRNFKLR